MNFFEACLKIKGENKKGYIYLGVWWDFDYRLPLNRLVIDPLGAYLKFQWERLVTSEGKFGKYKDANDVQFWHLSDENWHVYFDKDKGDKR